MSARPILIAAALVSSLTMSQAQTFQTNNEAANSPVNRPPSGDRTIPPLTNRFGTNLPPWATRTNMPRIMRTNAPWNTRTNLPWNARTNVFPGSNNFHRGGPLATNIPGDPIQPIMTNSGYPPIQPTQPNQPTQPGTISPRQLDPNQGNNGQRLPNQPARPANPTTPGTSPSR